MKGSRKTNKLVGTDNSTGDHQEEQVGKEGEEGKGRMNGDGRRLGLRWYYTGDVL